jgi:predicted RNA-binding protein with PIN domain
VAWVIDGSNVLGALGVDRDAAESKRRLVAKIAAFARAKRTRVTCFFDGLSPDAFPRQLGTVTIRFAHPRTADERISELLAEPRENSTLVTSDRVLATRLRTRRVSVIGASEFVAMLERLPRDENGINDSGTDWEAYFSDPKNRNV